MLCVVVAWGSGADRFRRVVHLTVHEVEGFASSKCCIEWVMILHLVGWLNITTPADDLPQTALKCLRGLIILYLNGC